MADRIAAVVRGERDLEAVALELFAWQREINPLYRRVAAGEEPGTIEAIPAVPVELFKELDLCPWPDAAVEFRTSGTTSGRRGRHRMRDTVLYDLGARRQMAGLPRRVLSLVPRDDASSLDHMVRLLGEPEYLMGHDGLVAEPWRRIGGPAFLACTAFALDALLALPGAADGTGLHVMVTGGYKGRAHRLDPPTLYRALGERLPGATVQGEYGMTELSSQLWTEPVTAGDVPGPFRAPPWLRAWAVDAASGEPVRGEGQLRFVDLCNLDSVLAIETQDLGVVDGPWVTLRGRLEGAAVRGCSLTAEELLG
jgi:hypothetical protein